MIRLFLWERRMRHYRTTIEATFFGTHMLMLTSALLLWNFNLACKDPYHGTSSFISFIILNCFVRGMTWSVGCFSCSQKICYRTWQSTCPLPLSCIHFSSQWRPLSNKLFFIGQLIDLQKILRRENSTCSQTQTGNTAWILMVSYFSQENKGACNKALYCVKPVL